MFGRTARSARLLRVMAAALLLLSYIVSLPAFSRGDDSSVEDNRATATGKPLAFRGAGRTASDQQPHLAIRRVDGSIKPASGEADESSPPNSPSAIEPVPAPGNLPLGPPSGPIVNGSAEAPPNQPYPGRAGAGPLWPNGNFPQQFAEPLHNASWGNRPVHIDGFIGGIRATELMTGRMDQSTGFLGGSRLGWDYDPYWGLEARLAYSSIQDSTETTPPVESADKVLLWDTSLLYYPYGDTRCRPYLSVGLGLAEFDFIDDIGQWHRRGLVEIPVGGGVKYRVRDWLTLRFDVDDNIALGQGQLRTVHMISFTTGLEYHWGGCHRNYWPWEPVPHY